MRLYYGPKRAGVRRAAVSEHCVELNGPPMTCWSRCRDGEGDDMPQPAAAPTAEMDDTISDEELARSKEAELLSDTRRSHPAVNRTAARGGSGITAGTL